MQANTIKIMKHQLQSIFTGGDLLLIVPPFGSLHDVAFGPHLLQALAGQHGYKADILYLNLLLASAIGVEQYDEIYNAPESWLLGERLFARCAWGPEWEQYLPLAQTCAAFLTDSAATIAALDYPVVGCTAMIGQVNASAVLLAGIKQQRPQVVTLIGGGACEGEMAEGVASLNASIDYIFSGESEQTFPEVLQWIAGKMPAIQKTGKTPAILYGSPYAELDRLPLPDYQMFFNQYTRWIGQPSPRKIKIWYESSRGCWYGQKSRCRFCSEHQPYRHKSAQTVAQDLRRINQDFPGYMVCMADVNLPRSYHQDLLPHIGRQNEAPFYAYQVKTDLSLSDLMQLKQANIKAVLPGIETFSTPLLRLMNKGVNARQNLLFLRHARSLGIYCDWLLLWGFPGDRADMYTEVLRILPLMRHLQPPRRASPMFLARFSTYFEERQSYNLRHVRPWEAFYQVFPPEAQIEKLAYWFQAKYPSEVCEDSQIIRAIQAEVEHWKRAWRTSRLALLPYADGYVILDTRHLEEQEKTYFLTQAQAQHIMTCREYEPSAELDRALEQHLGVVVDDWYVPLVTAKPELLIQFESSKISALQDGKKIHSMKGNF